MFKKFALLAACAALIASRVSAQQISTSGPGASPTITGTQTINPAYAGSGALSNGLCFNAPSPIAAAQHCLAYGTSTAQAGQLEIYNNVSGANVLTITNLNANGFSSITYRGYDPWTGTRIEHNAHGFNTQGDYDQDEYSRFDGNNNPLLPPVRHIQQNTGGIDPTGGVGATCAVVSGSPNLTCLTAVGANGTMVAAGTTFLGITADPIPAGIPAYTTILSGGGTTTPVMSANATATNASESLVFLSPVYGQHQFYQNYMTGPVIWNNWDNSANLTIDRIHDRLGVNTAFPTTTLTVNGIATIPQIYLTGNLSLPSWTTVGPILSSNGATTTLTDTTGTGTIAVETAASLPVVQLNATNAGVTVTNLDTLYLPQPVAGTNVTATNRNSLHAAGPILAGGQITGTAGAVITNGTVTLATNGLNINQNAGTNTTNLAAGTTSGTVTLGGSSNATKLGSATLQGPGGIMWQSSTAPTVTSGLGTSPTVLATNGTSAFKITVGASGSPAAAEVLAMPAATNGWVCTAYDITTSANTAKQTAFATSSVTLTWSGAPSLSDVLVHQCAAL